MTVTIHRRPGQSATQLLQELNAVATGPTRFARGGVEVDDATALAYLTARADVDVEPVTRRPVLAEPVAQRVRAVESTGGLNRPVEPKKTSTAAKSTRSRSRAGAA